MLKENKKYTEKLYCRSIESLKNRPTPPKSVNYSREQ